jgi:pimeloyl-ACP methyl ester carboxylesterase
MMLAHNPRFHFMSIRHLCRILILGSACLLTHATLGAEQKSAWTRTLPGHDGLKLVGDVRGQGDTALVFLHGWSGNRSWWEHQLTAFTNDYLVVAYDQAGHGESGKNRELWDFDTFARDVQAVVSGLKINRAILVGHSMGGPIALRAASLMPGVIIAVVGVDTLQNADYRPPAEQIHAFKEGMRTNFSETVRFGIRGMLPGNTDTNLLERISAGAEKQEPRIATAIMSNLLSLNIGKLLKEARVPVRCINATAGTTVFGIPTDTELNRRHADFQALLMTGVGHFPMLERPEEFNQKLREVLKEFAREQ